MSPSSIRLPLLLAVLLPLAAAPLRAQSDPVPAPTSADSAPARDSLAPADGARPDSAVRALPESLLGRWSCARATADYEPPLVLEVRADGRWADRSTSRAILARWEWDGAVLRLLRAGGDVRHAMRAEGAALLSDEGYRCRRE